MSSEERLDASRIVIILVGRHRWQKSEYPPKQQTSKRNMYPLEKFNLPLPFPASLAGMVQSYTLLRSHNILIQLAMRSFHWLQRMVSVPEGDPLTAQVHESPMFQIPLKIHEDENLYLISYMFSMVKEGFPRIYVKFLTGKRPKVCGGCSVLCQLHDNLSMCRGSFLNLTCCQAQIETTEKYQKTCSSMYNIFSCTHELSSKKHQNLTHHTRHKS